MVSKQDFHDRKHQNFHDELTWLLRNEGISGAESVARRLLDTLGGYLVPSASVATYKRARLEMAYMTARHRYNHVRHERDALIESLTNLADAAESAVDAELIADARRTLTLARPSRGGGHL